jgi:predicted ATPase
MNIEFRPTGSNLLIGPNNSGKTNLCSAINFLSLTSRLPLDDAIKYATGETWNVSNVYVNDNILDIGVECLLPLGSEEILFDYNIKLLVNRDNITGSQSLILKEEILKATGSRFDQTVLLANRSGDVKLLNEIDYFNKHSDSYLTYTVNTKHTMLSSLFNEETNHCANLLKIYLQSWGYFNFNPFSIRFPDFIPGGPLFSNGSNLNLVLFTLHNQNPRLEKKIIDAVKLLEPKLEYFTFVPPKPDQIYFFMEDIQHHQFSPQSISDGTLRYIAMIYLIYSVAYPTDPNSVKPFYIIEEPENGIYVGHLKPLFEKIDPSGKSGQFVFTTHNPYIIDLFDNNPDGLHLMKPRETSSILLKPDYEKIKKLLDKFSLGELYYREMIS